MISLGLWLRSREKKIEYYDQIKLNKEKSHKEMKYNPSPIRWIRFYNRKFKVLGEFYLGFREIEKGKREQKTTREWSEEEIRNWEIYNLKKQITGEKTPKYIAHKFSIQRNNFWGLFYYGEVEDLVLFRSEFVQTKADTIRIHEDRGLIFRDHLLVTTKHEAITLTSDETERLLGDHLVNSRGQQMKDFSRIRTDYAHKELMRDKDSEAEEKKERGKQHG